MMPDQLLIIVNRMLADVTGTKEAPEKIDFSQFRKFLDMNPALRQVVRDSLKPGLWTLEGHGPVLKEGKGNNPQIACCSATRTTKKSNSMQPVDRKTLYTPGDKPQNMEGALLKMSKES